MEYVVLVNEHDRETGTMEKMEAHRKGLLHRAFSILLFNGKGELLLQKRSADKYHSGGLWTNTCCSHPGPDEKMEDAIRRKLKQEMGINVPLDFAFKFLYRAELDHHLIENELDHVFTGRFDGIPDVNPREVEDWRFASIDNILNDMNDHPERYSYWFKVILRRPEVNFLQAGSLSA